jgi:hypothetical protein
MRNNGQAFNTLRLNVILPIAIAVLVIALMDDKLKMQKR